MTPFERVADLAADMESESLPGLGQELRTSHEGIFNGTELYMAWRFHVAKALDEPRLSDRTRAKALALWQMLDGDLS